MREAEHSFTCSLLETEILVSEMGMPERFCFSSALIKPLPSEAHILWDERKVRGERVPARLLLVRVAPLCIVGKKLPLLLRAAPQHR